MSNGLYEAPKSNLGALAELYMAGQAQVQKIRGEVTKQRAEESQNLTDMIEKISLTGLQDADKMYNEGAVKLREVISKAQQDNANGLITRQEATRIANAAISQADLLVNSTELIGNKYEELKEEVSKGNKSQADLDKFENAYFGNTNAIGGNSVVTLEYGHKGLEFSRKYTYTDPLSNQQVVGVINSPLADGINPTAQGIAGYDGDDWADSVRKRIRDMAMPVQTGTGQGPGGSQVYNYVTNPMNSDSVIEGVELMIDEYTDDELIGVLYDGMAGRATYSPSYQGFNSRQLLMKYKNFDGTSKFHTFDANNKLIDIDFDPAKDGDLFKIDHELDGTLKINDRQKELARAYLRMNAFRALGIDYKDKFGRKPKGRTTDPVTSDANFGNFNYISAAAGTRDDVYGTGDRSYTANTLNIIQNLANYEAVNQEMVTAQGSSLVNLKNYSDAHFNAYMNQSPFVEPLSNTGSPSTYNDNYNKFERIAGIDSAETKKNSKSRLFGVEDSNFTNLLISETGSKRQPLNLSTINGNKFDAITDIGYVMTDDGKYTIILHGSTESGVETLTSNTGQGGGDKKSTVKKTSPAFGYASPAQAKVLYNKLMAQYTKFNDKETAANHLQAGKQLVGTSAGSINDAYAYAITKILQELAP